MSYNFGSNNSFTTTTGMYENLPSSLVPSSRRQGGGNGSSRGIGDKVDHKNESGRERQPIPPRRRPFLNEAGQSGGMLLTTGINHSSNGLPDNTNKTHHQNYSSTAQNPSSGEHQHNDDQNNSSSNESGDVPRFSRAKSEKREIVDKNRWFTQSFASAGGLHQNNVSGDGCCNQSEDSSAAEGISVAERKRMFEAQIFAAARNPDTSGSGGNGSNTSGKSSHVVENSSRSGARLVSHEHQPHHHSQHHNHQSKSSINESHSSGERTSRQQIPYRGSKTAPTPNIGAQSHQSTVSDEWDFLATLNEILRRENFLGDDDVEYGKDNSDGLKSTSSASHGKHVPSSMVLSSSSTFSQEANKVDFERASKSGTSAGQTTPTAPMSPRPPRPNRFRAGERRKEYARTRSLDAAHFGLVTNRLSTPNNNNNNNHELHGSNDLLSGSNIDLSTATTCNSNSSSGGGGSIPGVAGGSIVGGYSANKQNQHQSSKMQSSPHLQNLLSQSKSSSQGKNLHNNKGSNEAGSCITIVENPFQQASNSLSVLPLSSSPQFIEHQRQTLLASPVMTSSLINTATPSNPFLALMNSNSGSTPQQPQALHNSGERSVTPCLQQQHQTQNRLTTESLPLNSSFLQQQPQYHPHHHQQLLLSPLTMPQSASSSSARVTRSPLLNTVSSSLDSIYERLKANEYLDPIGPSRPLTQVYFDRNFGIFADYYGINPFHGENGRGKGYSAFNNINNSDDNNIGYASHPNLFENSSTAAGCDTTLENNFYPSRRQNDSSGSNNTRTTDSAFINLGNNNVISSRGRMSPFQPSQMMLENTSCSSSIGRYDGGTHNNNNVHKQSPSPQLFHGVIRSAGGGCGDSMLGGGSLSNLAGVPSGSNNSNNHNNNGNNAHNITAVGNHSGADVGAFPINPPLHSLSSAGNAAGSWWNLPSDYRGRSYGSFKSILAMDLQQSRSPEYSYGFEPLQVEEGDYEDFEDVDMLASSASSTYQITKESSSCCSEIDDDEERMTVEDSSGCSEDDDETEECSENTSTVESSFPKDASRSIRQPGLSSILSSAISLKDSTSSSNIPQDVSCTATNSNTNKKKLVGGPTSSLPTGLLASSSVKNNYGLQKMPSYEFKFTNNISNEERGKGSAVAEMGKDGCGVGEVGGNNNSSSSGSSNPTTDSSSSTITGKLDVSSSTLGESSKTNKICQSSSSSSSQAAAGLGCSSIATARASPTANFLSFPSSALLGGMNNLSSLASSTSEVASGGGNRVGKSTKSVSGASGAVSGGLFTGLGAKIPVINPSATAALEKHFKSLNVAETDNTSPSPTGRAFAIDGEDNFDNNIANNNNNVKRNSRNLENVSFLSAGLPPIPPTTSMGNSSTNLINQKETLIPPQTHLHSKPTGVRVSLPTKSSKQGRLKSPSRRKSSVISPPPVSFEEMSIGGGSVSGKSTKKKLAGSKRYASSLPDRERCSATSPVAFDLNSYLCHSQGPIDFSSLLNRVHQQQQLLHQHQHQLAHHAAAQQQQPHIIHHPQPTVPFMGHPKPTKHCKNKHMWARASLQREVLSGSSIPSPTPSNSGGNGGQSLLGCNNLSGGINGNSGIGNGADINKSTTCSSKFAVGGAALPTNPSNRHSSYHPNYGFGESTAALQAAAAAYNAHILFSRPTSPLFLGESASCCGDYSASFCPGCATKTFPRVAARSSGAHHGLCYCCHQNGSSGGGINNANQSSNRASTSTPGVCGGGGDGTGGSLLGLDYEDRLLRLESDKDTLHLQVSVLSDQIEAQTAKIHDLEKMLDDKKNVLETTEEQLNRELLLRSSLETQKLELMTEISSLRLKHASLERENIELKDRVVGKSTGDLSFIDSGSGGLSSRIWEKPPIGPERAASPSSHSISIDPSVVAAARARLGSASSEQYQLPPQRTRTPPANAYRRVDQSAFGTIPRRSPHSSQLSANSTATFNGSILGGGGQPGTGGGGMGDHGKSNSLSSGNLHAISTFSTGLQQLTQQQKTLQEHQLLLFQQQQLLLNTVHNNRKTFSPVLLSWERDGEHGSENEEMEDTTAAAIKNDLQQLQLQRYQETDQAADEEALRNNDPFVAAAFSSTDPLPSDQSSHVPFLVEPSPLCSPSSSSTSCKTPSSPGNNRSSTSGAWAYRKARRAKAPVAAAVLGGGIVSSISRVFNSRSSCRSTSTPNLVTITDGEQWDRSKAGSGGAESNNGTSSNKSKQSPTNGSSSHKSRGILRILGKLKRSNSGGLDNDVAPLENTFPTTAISGGPFVRGGVRATAHPRLGWMKDPSPIIKKPDGPVNSWDSEAVITWLNYLGLGTYAGEVKRWVKSGQQLLDASNHELEKELGIKNTLHRKKLSLALYSLRHPEEEDNAGKLDYHFIIRWLDDVGLPQYKESFMEARIDGRVLGHLTAEDLVSLKVTSVLHHASLKRGIQLLRIHKFDPNCVLRRGGPNPGAVSNGGGTMTTGGIGSGGILLGNSNGGTNGTGGSGIEHSSSTASLPSGSVWGPKHVATWTNHRVMEWLKAIDLAEYAPNLRGSGVHGALIMFEPRFNSELMATLLAIPGNKTLLRRHLSLQFNELVGRHIVQEKRISETSSDFVPLNPTTKVKLPKKSQFPLRKKRLSTEMTEDLLCPQDLNTYPFITDSTLQITTPPAAGSVVRASGEGKEVINEMSVDGTKTVGEEKVSDI